MKLLRYFARTAAGVTALVLVGLVVLIVAVTLVESAGDLTGADAGEVAAFWLALYGGAQNSYELLPIACFMGALVAGTLLARRGELLAAQAAGVSGVKLSLSLLAVVVIFSVGGALAGEWLVPRAVAGLERVQRESLRHTSALTRFYNRQLKWFREGDLLLYLPAAEPETQSFVDPVVYRFDDGLISEVIEAHTLRHDAAGWRLEQARVRSVTDARVLDLPVVRLDLRVRPRDLLDVTGDPRQMTSAEIRGLIHRRTNAGFDATPYRIELNHRIALPLSAIWMFLLVAPWALHPERRRSMPVTLGAGVITIAALLSVTHVFRLLALGHKIPVALGAWGSGIVTLVLLPASFVLYRRYRIHGSIF